MRYFIGNWKMFGVPKSISILNKINSYYSRDKNRNKYRAIITPPFTLIESYAKYFKNKKILIGVKMLSKRTILVKYCRYKPLHVEERRR